MGEALLRNNYKKSIPGYELIADVEVKGSTATQIDFTELAIGKEDDLLLVGETNNPTASGATLYLYVNDDVAGVNYRRERTVIYGTTIKADHENTASFAYTKENGYSTNFLAHIKLTQSGRCVFQNRQNKSFITDSGLEIDIRFGATLFEVSSISKLSLKSNVSNGIGLGSRFRLYKRIAKVIADIIVPTDTTSINITGVTIDKNSRYALISDVTGSNNCRMYLFTGDSVLESDYRLEYMQAEGATITSGRYDGATMSYISEGKRSLSITDLALTNREHFVFYSMVSWAYDAQIAMVEYVSASKFTITEITQLTIQASAVNGIGAGSRFQLIKLK